MRSPTAVAAAFLLAAGCVAFVAAASDAPETPPQHRSPTVVDRGLAVVPPGGAGLSPVPGARSEVQAASGLVLPVVGERDGWLEVTTTCADTRWVAADTVEVIPPADPATPGTGFDLAAAVVVVDPGHGAEDWGGTGPTGLREKDVNLDIAERLRVLLSSSRDVDWSTGDVSAGASIPAVAAVWMTRDPTGPLDGDVETSLAYRAEVADAVGADALVSIHNNTVPKGTRSTPGTEVFFSVGTEGSDRLASLIHEELVRSLVPFDAPWSGKSDAGLRGRVDPETGEDFYGLLRRATVPTVIVEGLYISEAPEEALLERPDVRQAYAEGVYRGLVRFLTTDAVGTDIPDPEPWTGSPGRPSFASCEVPTEP